jgi:predicted enzyme related to lactoylglutathione lyase
VTLRGGITIFASDLRASRRFYGDQLGLALNDDEDGFWARADGLELRVEGGARKRRLSREFYEEAGVLVRLETTAFDTFLGGIISRGVKLFGEVKDSDEGRFVGFVDPDGNLFELIESGVA